MKPALHFLLAAALLGGGAILGRSLHSATRATASPASPQPGKSAAARAGGGITAKSREGKDQPGDLAALKERYAQRKNDNTPLRREMERLSPAQLRALVLERIPLMSGQGDEKDRMANRMMVNAAIRELYKREGEAAMDWASGLGSRDARRGAMAGILYVMTGKDPAATERWLTLYRKDYGKDSMMNMELLTEGLKGAAERNDIAAITRIQEFIGLGNLSNPLHNAEFPEEFDFAALYRSLGSRMGMSDAIAQWAIRDPDAAWATIRGALDEPMDKNITVMGRRENGFSHILSGIAAEQGESAAMQWAAERLKDLPDAQREKCLRALDAGGNLSPSGIAAIAALLPPEDRKTLAAGFMGGNALAPKAIAALSALPHGEMVSVLEQRFEPFSGNAPPLTGPARAAAVERVYDNLRSRFSLTDEEMARIRKRHQGSEE